MSEDKKIRIDKWLWAVRVYKTRTQATNACNAGRARVGEEIVKASRKISVGETITVRKGPLTIIYEVEKIIAKRVSATLAAECFKDHSPPPPPRPVFSKRDAAFLQLPTAYREKGTGRPTKKERRELDKMDQELWMEDE